jgi:hypothetical protein
MHHDPALGAHEQERPRDTPNAPFGAIDIESRRLAREAKGCLQEVLADMRDLEVKLARFRAWLAVPAEFRRARDRVA